MEFRVKAANPYLNFNGNTEEAFEFYRSVFGGEFASLVRFADFGGDAMGVPEQDRQKIAHIALPLGPANTLMGTDALEAWQTVTTGDNFSIMLEAESAEEAGRLFAALSDGGRVAMALQPTEWAEQHGVCTDRFGVQWMINYTGTVTFG